MCLLLTLKTMCSWITRYICYLRWSGFLYDFIFYKGIWNTNTKNVLCCKTWECSNKRPQLPCNKHSSSFIVPHPKRTKLISIFLKVDLIKMVDCINFMVNLWYSHTQNVFTSTTFFPIEICFCYMTIIEIF